MLTATAMCAQSQQVKFAGSCRPDKSLEEYLVLSNVRATTPGTTNTEQFLHDFMQNQLADDDDDDDDVWQPAFLRHLCMYSTETMITEQHLIFAILSTREDVGLDR